MSTQNFTLEFEVGFYLLDKSVGNNDEKCSMHIMPLKFNFAQWGIIVPCPVLPLVICCYVPGTTLYTCKFSTLDFLRKERMTFFFFLSFIPMLTGIRYGIWQEPASTYIWLMLMMGNRNFQTICHTMTLARNTSTGLSKSICVVPSDVTIQLTMDGLNHNDLY